MSLIFSVMPKRLTMPPATRTAAAAVERPTAPLVLRKDATGGVGRCRRCTFSTGAVDRQRDVINQAGWDLRAYRRNPLLLFGHNYQSLPVGRVPDVHVEGDALVGTPEWAPPELSPFADEVRRLVEGGYLNTFSVGFRPIRQSYNEARGGIDFLEMELLEISVVPVPANAEALVGGRGQADAVRRWIGGGGVAAPRGLELDGDDAVVLEVADDDAADAGLMVDGRALSREALGALVTERVLAQGRGLAAAAMDTLTGRLHRARMGR